MMLSLLQGYLNTPVVNGLVWSHNQDVHVGRDEVHTERGGRLQMEGDISLSPHPQTKTACFSQELMTGANPDK